MYEKEQNVVSNCCTASIYPETDICKDCGEHCQPISETDEDQERIKQQVAELFTLVEKATFTIRHHFDKTGEWSIFKDIAPVSKYLAIETPFFDVMKHNNNDPMWDFKGNVLMPAQVAMILWRVKNRIMSMPK